MKNCILISSSKNIKKYMEYSIFREALNGNFCVNTYHTHKILAERIT